MSEYVNSWAQSCLLFCIRDGRGERNEKSKQKWAPWIWISAGVAHITELFCPVLGLNFLCHLSLTLPRLGLQFPLCFLFAQVNLVVLETYFSPQDLADLVRIHKWLMFIYQEHPFLNMRRQRGERWRICTAGDMCLNMNRTNLHIWK